MTGTTLLLRQIRPGWIQAGFVTSQAYRPTPEDESLLSVYDGTLISPEASFAHYTGTLRLASVGTTGLTVAECLVEGLSARPDPEPFPEHAVIDFTGLNDGQCRAKSKKLQARAQSRGWLYPAPTSN